jgi:hypothetical protein
VWGGGHLKVLRADLGLGPDHDELAPQVLALRRLPRTTAAGEAGSGAVSAQGGGGDDGGGGGRWRGLVGGTCCMARARALSSSCSSQRLASMEAVSRMARSVVGWGSWEGSRAKDAMVRKGSGLKAVIGASPCRKWLIVAGGMASALASELVEFAPRTLAISLKYFFSLFSSMG